MFTKKKRLLDEIVMKSNSLERKMALDAIMSPLEMSHALGAREAYLSIYKFINATDHQSDEIAIEEIDKFCWAQRKHASEIAYSTDLGVDFPYNKKLALGKILAYNTIQTELDHLKAEMETDEESA